MLHEVYAMLTLNDLSPHILESQRAKLEELNRTLPDYSDWETKIATALKSNQAEEAADLTASMVKRFLEKSKDIELLGISLTHLQSVLAKSDLSIDFGYEPATVNQKITQLGIFVNTGKGHAYKCIDIVDAVY